MSLFTRLIEEMRAVGRDVDTTTQELFAAADKRIAALEGKGTVEADTSVEDALKAEVADLKVRLSKAEAAIAEIPAVRDVTAVVERVGKLETEVFGDGDASEKSSADAKTPTADVPAAMAASTTSAITPAAAPVSDADAQAKASVENAAMEKITTGDVSQDAGKIDPASNTSENAADMAPVPLANTDADHPADTSDPTKSGFAAMSAKADA